MPWCINYVNSVRFAFNLPISSSGSRLNSNTSLLFLFHKVHFCCTFMHFSDFMFLTLTSRVNITSALTITLTNGVQSYAIVVGPNGNVSDQGFL